MGQEGVTKFVAEIKCPKDHSKKKKIGNFSTSHTDFSRAVLKVVEKVVYRKKNGCHSPFKRVHCKKVNAMATSSIWPRIAKTLQ